MTTQPVSERRRYTVSEYLRMEYDSHEKHEYRDGYIIPMGEIIGMAGGSSNHSVITSNIIGELHHALKGKPCRVFDSNMRVRIPRTPLYTYPDVNVTCGQAQFDPGDEHQETIVSPRVIVEVLSPSSEGYDRGEKFTRYRLLDSLKEYVLVSQDSPSVEIFLRQDGGTWLLNPVAGLDALAHLESIDVQIPLSEIYAGVQFPPPVEPPAGAV